MRTTSLICSRPNRELGIILTGTGVAQAVATTIETTFDSDYSGGTTA
ncbi:MULTISPECIES: hypothetical protein [Streptomyces]|jgi:hypothetical protein|uniref:Uncharacterized protein n=1 Tax=Streptomyces mirabilis TaxID=68239 RepID=A0ABU3UD25_9ACTN|nr:MULTISPECIES: hypothetical protein [Streptomyces]MCX4614507.1 hypothetical protein [Streptomyces mirabilis]MCX5354620.1 hypothetical protein [Streptomyces mirabilis]MDU8991799.1 hypothetical protein [Streptomyces mirabilis]SOE33135.1 hypothetical protein SAMN05442782_10151 [Streptomyces sp. OK228]